MLNRLIPIATAAVLVLSGSGIAQAQRRLPSPPPTPAIVDVPLEKVGRSVARGVIEVDPEKLKGKRLLLTPATIDRQVIICIGRWRNGECRGVVVVFDKNVAD